MAVRAGMAALIDLVERLINDEANDYHSAQEVQDALDQNREEARYLELTAVSTIAEGGAVSYLTFTAPFPYWETDGVLLDSDYATLTPSTSDWMIGRWVMGSEPDRPVKLLGWTYDVYAAAADLLDVRASMVAEDLQSFSGQNGAFTYASVAPSLRSQAAAYRAKARAASVQSLDVNRVDLEVY